MPLNNLEKEIQVQVLFFAVKAVVSKLWGGGVQQGVSGAEGLL